MAEDLAPVMLARLDAKLAAGEIDQYEHEMRRAEVIKAAREGKTIELSGRERIWQFALGIIGVVGGIALIAGFQKMGAGPLAFVLAGIFAVACFLAARKVGKRF